MSSTVQLLVCAFLMFALAFTSWWIQRDLRDKPGDQFAYSRFRARLWPVWIIFGLAFVARAIL